MPYPYNYTKLWEPIQINGMKLRNRISLSPMGTYTPRLDGTDTEEGMRYYEERAKGGVGLIMTGAMFVNEQLAQGSPGIAVWDYHSIPSTTVLTERCHRWGAKVCLQLSGGCGRNGAIDTGATENMFSASDNPNFFDPSIICHALTIEEIKESLKDWAIDADIAVRSGFDAIEVHAHAGYIIDQFMSPIWNRRTDEYGGSFENRARYACEIVQTIRKVVGPKFPILFRISLDHRFNGGRTLEDSVPLLGILEKAGVDAFDVDVASYEHLDLIYPTVYYGDSVTSYVCKEARKHVTVPIINGGSHTMETAVDLLESGDADIIQFGRQLIADPDFPNKLKDNRRDDIRPCLLCNEECIGRIMGRQSQLSCTVNIQACMEGHYQITKLPEPKNVVVIGAGPGGLEAARVAAMRGCKVTLFEKSGKIGGNFGTIASVGFKHRIRDLIWWYNNQLNKLGVDLRLNTEITADDPILGSADAIFLATGSVPLVPPIPGAVHNAERHDRARLPPLWHRRAEHRHLRRRPVRLRRGDRAPRRRQERQHHRNAGRHCQGRAVHQQHHHPRAHEGIRHRAAHVSARRGHRAGRRARGQCRRRHRVQDRGRYGSRRFRPEVQHRSRGQDLRQVSHQVQLHRRLQPGRQIRQGHP